jgi:hypothetical protein
MLRTPVVSRARRPHRSDNGHHRRDTEPINDRGDCQEPLTASQIAGMYRFTLDNERAKAALPVTLK